MTYPRIIFSALRGGSGKTILSIGVIAAWKEMGKTIAPFKKGPDYIDAGWLAAAAGRPCYNLDTFLVDEADVLESFLFHAEPADISLVEGNRGLYDAIDDSAGTSTADLAKLLKAPVVLCLDCTKSTRTMAAVVLGCLRFDPGVPIKGVILNRVAGPRHESILRNSIEHHCGTPVLGAVPKLRAQNFPERHMGLVPTPEHSRAADSIVATCRIAQQYLDLEGLAAIAHSAPPGLSPLLRAAGDAHGRKGADLKTITDVSGVRIGVIRDSAFQFYYPDNLDALVSAGAKLVFISPFQSRAVEPLDALYIGGGFPETHAAKLAENDVFRRRLKSLAEGGLPIYAECGGLMYLGKELVLEDGSYPMAGVLPIVFGFSKKPQGHGYTVFAVEGKNPYFSVGTELRGHEFHYSKILEWDGKDKDMVFRMKRGNGIINGRDGICFKNVLATYSHIHALGAPSWAAAMVANALSYRKSEKQCG
jgi:cobyrinic acid a,c-diamide synthase